MNSDNLNELSYRELQAKAKACGIAANQKKDILIEELLKQNTQEPESTESDIELQAVEITPEVTEDVAVESLVVNEEPEDANSEIVCEETAEDVVNETLAVEENISIPVEAAIEIVEDISETQDVVVQESDAVVESYEVPTAAEESVLILEDDAILMEDDEELEFFEAQEYYEENDSEDLVEMFSDMKLRGIATPAGKKIVFVPSDEITNEQKVNWGINFNGENDDDEEEENFDENEENYNAEEYENRGGFKIGSTPKGKHTVFASPELKMGNGVHWTYDDYNKPVLASTTPVKTAPKMTTTQQKLRFEATEPTLLNTQTPGKKLQNQGDQMNFWLAKGPKTPIR